MPPEKLKNGYFKNNLKAAQNFLDTIKTTHNLDLNPKDFEAITKLLINEAKTKEDAHNIVKNHKELIAERIKEFGAFGKHDVYINYLDLRKDSKIIAENNLQAGSHLVHDTGFLSNWFNEKNNLNPLVIKHVLKKIINNNINAKYLITYGGGRYNINGTIIHQFLNGKSVNSKVKKGVLTWIKELEEYIWNHYEKTNSTSKKAQEEKEKARMELEDTKDNPVTKVLKGGWEDLTSGDPAKMAPVLALVWSAYIANKKTDGKILNIALVATGAYSADLLQAKYTDLNGGDMLIDSLFNTEIRNQYKHTPTAAMLHKVNDNYSDINLTNPEFMYASLLLEKVPLVEVLNFLQEMEMDAGFSSVDELPSVKAKIKKYPALKKAYDRLLDTKRYTEENELMLARAMFHTIRAFAFYSGQKSSLSLYPPKNFSSNISRGITYLKVRNGLINPSSIKNKEMAGYFKRLSLRVNKKNPKISFGESVRREVIGKDINESIEKGKNTLIQIKEFLGEKYSDVSPYIIDFAKNNWDTYGKPFLEWMTDTAGPWVYTNGVMTLNYTKGQGAKAIKAFNAWYSHTAAPAISTTAKTAIDAAEFTYSLAGTIVTTTLSGVKSAIEEAEKVYHHSVKWFESLFEPEKEIIISSGTDLYNEMFDGIDNKEFRERIMKTYGLIRERDLNHLCKDLFDGGKFEKMINEFRKHNKKGPYTTGDKIKKKEVAEAFYIGYYGLFSFINGATNIATTAERTAIDITNAMLTVSKWAVGVSEGVLMTIIKGTSYLGSLASSSVPTVSFGMPVTKAIDDFQNFLKNLKVDPKNVHLYAGAKAIYDVILTQRELNNAKNPVVWTQEKIILTGMEVLRLPAYASKPKSEKEEFIRMLYDTSVINRVLPPIPPPKKVYNRYNATGASPSPSKNAYDSYTEVNKNIEKEAVAFF